MKSLIALFVSVLLSGCVGGYVKVKDKKNEETCYVFYMSIFRDVDAANVDVCGVTGGSDKSNVQTEFMSDILKVYTVPVKPFSLLKD